MPGQMSASQVPQTISFLVLLGVVHAKRRSYFFDDIWPRACHRRRTLGSPAGAVNLLDFAEHLLASQRMIP
jgi:hypothetical protein